MLFLKRLSDEFNLKREEVKHELAHQVSEELTELVEDGKVRATPLLAKEPASP
jgi:hypothetical protein